jgi:hypothetical protein
VKFKKTITRTSQVDLDARLMQAQGIFDLPPEAEQTLVWNVDLELPADWSVGAIVGESGSGKTTLAREIAAKLGTHVIEAKDAQGNLKEPFEWAPNAAIASAMPGMPITDWTGLLSRVGFSSPPAWCRPYRVLSNGQQFRANLARAIAETWNDGGKGAPVCFDEFASLVHDQVAKIASAAVSKAVRSMKRQLVAVTWRTDILESLEPDWVIFCGSDQSVRLELNTNGDRRRWVRPGIKMRVIRTDSSPWSLFRGHHYLSAELKQQGPRYFVGLVEGLPAAFVAALHFPHAIAPKWREHRTVCLPDFQGVGIGNAMSEYIASVFASLKPYTSTTSHPAMIAHRSRSPLWKTIRKPSLVTGTASKTLAHLGKTNSTSRLTASFQYVGPTRPDDARRFGLIKTSSPLLPIGTGA